MKITAKVDVRRLKTKLRRWERCVDKATLEDLKLYGQTAAKAMMKCTPPGNMKRTPGQAIKGLKERIREDWEGQGAEEKFQDKDVSWYRDTSGRPRAYFKADASSATGRKGQRVTGRVSPFRIVPRKPGKKVLAALNVGRYGVLYVDKVQQHVRSNHAVYKVYSKGRGSAARMWWYGARHIARKSDVRKEITRRQRLAGQLMAGWKPLAHKAGTRLPAAVEKQSGKGSAKIRHSMLHKATLEGRNSGHYPELQKLVNRQVPWILKRNRSIAKRRAKALGKKLG